jgi:hypothetical protein
MYSISPGSELLSDEVTGAEFFITQFWVGMDVAPQSHHVVLDITDTWEHFIFHLSIHLRLIEDFPKQIHEFNY